MVQNFVNFHFLETDDFFWNSVESSEFVNSVMNLMIPATLKGYWLYRNDAVVALDWNILLKFGFEKRFFFKKSNFT